MPPSSAVSLATLGPQCSGPCVSTLGRHSPRQSLSRSRDPLGILSLGSFLSNYFGFSHVGAFDGQGLALGSFLTAPVQNTLTVTSSFLLCALAVKLILLVAIVFVFVFLTTALLKCVSALLSALLHCRSGYVQS